MASCDPLRLFIYNDGLARFCTEKYNPPTPDNLQNICMHLTNYAINKNNTNFVFNSDKIKDNVGHKRTMTAVFKVLVFIFLTKSIKK